MLMGGGRGALRFGKGAAKGVGVAGLGAIGGGAAGLGIGVCDWELTVGS